MIRRETERRIHIADDIGLRFTKPYSKTEAQFRPTWVKETLQQTDQGSATYSVEVSGPIQNKSGTDSTSFGGAVRYGTGHGTQGAVTDIPSRIRGYLLGPEALAKAIALPKGGAL